MEILTAEHITKEFGIVRVLEDLSLRIQEGERIGLIGNNGSGKSTLLRILAGELEADGGSVRTAAGLRIGVLAQQEEPVPEQTVWQSCLSVFEEVRKLGTRIEHLAQQIANASDQKGAPDALLKEYQRSMDAFEEADGYRMESDIKGVLAGLGFGAEHYEQPVEQLSGGQRARVALARLLLQKPDLLLLDEPTNHLDLAAIAWLEATLAVWEGTLLVISHDRYFLDAVTTRTMLLDGALTSYDGNYTVFMEKHKKALADRAHAYENQQKEIRRQEEMIRRFENYGNKRYIIQARSRRRLLAQMERIEAPDAPQRAMRLRLTPSRPSGRDVLDVDELCVAFSQEPLFDGVSFHVDRGERIGIIGPNGVGKTTLFRVFRRHVEPTAGTFRFGTGVRARYLDQGHADLSPEKTILDEVWDAHPTLTHREIRNVLAAFLFYGDDIFKEVEDLSGGEKTRVALCKMMLSDANVLFLDEPTNHLDILSKEALEEACLRYEGTLLFISHDRYFLNRVAQRILAMEKDGVTSYLGNYDYYVMKTAPKAETSENEVSRTAQKKAQKKQRERAGEERKRRARLRSLEEEIALKESALSDIDATLADPALYDSPREVQNLAAQRNEIEDALSILYEEWLEIQEEDRENP